LPGIGRLLKIGRTDHSSRSVLATSQPILLRVIMVAPALWQQVDIHQWEAVTHPCNSSRRLGRSPTQHPSRWVAAVVAQASLLRKALAQAAMDSATRQHLAEALGATCRPHLLIRTLAEEVTTWASRRQHRASLQRTLADTLAMSRDGEQEMQTLLTASLRQTFRLASK